MRIVSLTKETTKDILEDLLKRSPNNYGNYEAAVAEILDKVQVQKETAPFLPIPGNLIKQRSRKKPSG